jgi:glycosyltransferase involved in cell wall biosynthesis
MKICLIGPTYPYRGGIAHYTTLLCHALRKSHDVKFISFKRQYPMLIYPGGATDRDPSGEPLKADGVDYLIDTLNPFTWQRAARAVCEYQPEAVIVPWWVAFFAPVFRSIVRNIKKGTNAKIVFICHNVVEHESSAARKWLTRMVLPLGDRFVVHSQDDKKNLLAFIPGADARVCHHPTYRGISPTRWSKNEAKAELGLAGPALLFFGYVRPYKGLDIAIEAMPRIREKIPASLLVAGQFFKGQEGHLKRIKALGLEECAIVRNEYVTNEEAALYFGACDAAALPYRSATGSGVVQLSFGFGRPVVATRVGCLPDVVRDGVDGRLAEPDNPKSFAEAAIDVLSPDNLTQYTQNAQQAAGRFSWDSLVDAALETSGKSKS